MFIGSGREATRSRCAARLRLLAVLVPVIALAAVLVPAAAQAQSPQCFAEVVDTQDPEVASFSVDCEPANVQSVQVDSSEEGSIEENTGTACTPGGEGTRFTCEPTSSSSLVSARFRATDGDVCDDPPLELTLTTDADGGAEEPTTAEVECSSEGGDGGSDDEDPPEGGVDTGAGGAHDAGQSPALRAGGITLAGLLLAVGALALRRRIAR